MIPADLIAFEDDIAAEFAAGKIKAPVHLAGGNERQLIDYFDENVAVNDYIFCSWRSHYHALLNGVPPAKLKAAIMSGHSIALCFPEHRMLSSAIVGGICPIAVGIAWAIKRRGGAERVHCFVGDMTSETGGAFESCKYAGWNHLPITWIVENNGKSVSTDTLQAWGCEKRSSDLWNHWTDDLRIERYHYKLKKPHVGIGKFVRF